MEASLGADHPNVALNFRTQAMFYAEQGKNEEAVSLTERAVHIQEEALPADSPVIRETLEQLARLYEKTGKTDTAKQTRDRLKALPATSPQE